MSAVHVVVDHLSTSGHSDAYFALAGALGGAAVGGMLGFGSAYGLARRSERAQAHATARLLRDDLYSARAYLVMALRDRKWWPKGVLLPTRSWLEPRVSLALFLSMSELLSISDAFATLIETNVEFVPHLGGQPVTDGPGLERLKMALGAVDEALLVLAAYDWHRKGGPLGAIRAKRARRDQATRLPTPRTPDKSAG